jgi:hypothetical protein
MHEAASSLLLSCTASDLLASEVLLGIMPGWFVYMAEMSDHT